MLAIHLLTIITCSVMLKEFLARDGVIVPLAAPVHGPLSLPYVSLSPGNLLVANSSFRAGAMFFQGYHVFSSLVGSRNVHDEMLEFSSRHGIKPMVQIFKHEGAKTIKEVFQLLEQNKMRYRAVLELSH